MSNLSDAFDRWIRGSFMEINTELEDLYFAQADRADVSQCGANLKSQLRDEGHQHVVALLAEGDTGDGFETAFGVLGNVGRGAVAVDRGHLGVVHGPGCDGPREVAVEHERVDRRLEPTAPVHPGDEPLRLRQCGEFAKSFTSLPDEILFIDENTRGILLLQLAADALAKVVPLGISSPIVDVPFAAAKHALEAVIESNQRLFDHLDVDRFFFSVRPYYKPYKVGRQEYRGANAGDFSGINEIDLLLGLCRANDPYTQLLVDKMQFMPPQDQARLRECIRHESFFDELLALGAEHGREDWFQRTRATSSLRVV
jgi:hypothetical protein